MKKIEKIISRDISILGMHADHIGLTTGLREWLGWSYSDLIFYFHDGYADLMMVSDEHYRDFLTGVEEKIEIDKAWFESEYQRFVEMTVKFQDYFDQSRHDLGQGIVAPDIQKIYQGFSDWMRVYYGPFVMMKWFPIWLENDDEKSRKYKKEIELAITARKKAELILPQGREITNLVLDQVRKKVPFDKSLVHFLTLSEFSDFLEKGDLPDPKILEQRKKGFIFSAQDVSLTDGSPVKAQKVFSNLGYQFDLDDLSKLTQFKGQIACTGRVTGVARLIMTKNAISSVKEGEILVTSMTTPEYLPAMKKAAAFVTDEGGITCHAAIVARELKKPCIIGTKIATKVLKDGDHVEIDANKGIVRIIPKK